MNAIDSYGHYLRDSVWPTGLAAFYPHPMDRLAMGSVAAAGTAIAAISAISLWSAARLPFLLVGWAWFPGTLVPMMGIERKVCGGGKGWGVGCASRCGWWLGCVRVGW